MFVPFIRVYHCFPYPAFENTLKDCLSPLLDPLNTVFPPLLIFARYFFVVVMHDNMCLKEKD